MVKHTQKIRLLLPTNCLSVFDHFVELALKGLTTKTTVIILLVYLLLALLLKYSLYQSLVVFLTYGFLPTGIAQSSFS